MKTLRLGLAVSNLIGAGCGFWTTVDCIRLGEWTDAAVGGALSAVALVVALYLVLPWVQQTQEGALEREERLSDDEVPSV